MITQNPIIGRSRKKLAGVYARTLWGKNVIQSLPSKSNIPPTKALKDSRSAFATIMQMANLVPKSLLYNIYYSAPVGRSRRHVLSSQLFTGVLRNNYNIAFSLSALSELGTNAVATNEGYLFTIQATNFRLAKALFSSTDIADTSRVPCVVAISYEMAVCLPLLSNVSIDGDDLVFSDIPGTFVGHEFLLLALWQVNIGTQQIPVWQYGSFSLQS